MGKSLGSSTINLPRQHGHTDHRQGLIKQAARFHPILLLETQLRQLSLGDRHAESIRHGLQSLQCLTLQVFSRDEIATLPGEIGAQALHDHEERMRIRHQLWPLCLRLIQQGQASLRIVHEPGKGCELQGGKRLVNGCFTLRLS